MTCYKPLKGWQIGWTARGKPEYKITTYYIDHVEYDGSTWTACPSDRVSPSAVKVVRDCQEIPCGHCIGCRMEYAKQWAGRCLLEMEQHENNLFLTLTYSDDHLTYVMQQDPGREDYKSLIATLVKRDFQLYMKRLRKALDYPVRFFAAGEYGDRSLRPHYHAIIFGLRKPDDLVLYKVSRGYTYYTSQWMDDIWQHGSVIIADANYKTAAYIARYCTKKAHGKDAAYFESLGLEPEFSLMSRRPGIGRQYYDDNVERIFSSDSIYISTPDGSQEIRPSRYYRKLMEMSDPERYAVQKEIDKITADDTTEVIDSMTSMSHMDYLAAAEEIKQKSLNKLVRNSATHEELWPDPIKHKPTNSLF